MRNEVADILMRKIKDPRIGFVTVTGVEVSDDLKNAKIFVSSYGGSREETLKGLKSASAFIRAELGRRMRLRSIPEILFRYDDTVQRGAHIMDLLHQLGGQVGWLSTWQGGAPRISLPSSEGAGFLENLADWFRRSDAAIREFIDALPEGELGRPRLDRMPGGRERTMMLWDMMVHVVNHGTQHRSEAAMALAAMGRSPGDLDFLDFVDLRRNV